MRIIYLSPHLDDAVLSAGGLIHEQADSGAEVEIWTFMAGTPADQEVPEFAQAMHAVWGFGNAAGALQTRRAEDLCAVAEVHAKAAHFDFLDCIYRRGRLGEALYSDVTLPIQPDDADLPVQIAQAMANSLQPDDIVVCQLGIGAHVDHLIVRRAAELLHRPLIYVADIPYVWDHPNELQPSVAGLIETLQPVSTAGFKSWVSAIECYVSQIEPVFGSKSAMYDRTLSNWRERRGVRFWTLPNQTQLHRPLTQRDTP